MLMTNEPKSEPRIGRPLIVPDGVTVNIYVPDALLERVDRCAILHGVSRSAIVRAALTLFLAKK